MSNLHQINRAHRASRPVFGAEAILQVLRGEPLDSLARELGVTATPLAHCREEFLAGGQAALKSRVADERDVKDLAAEGEAQRDHHGQRVAAAIRLRTLYRKPMG